MSRCSSSWWRCPMPATTDATTGMSQVCVWRDWVLDRVSAIYIYTYEGWWDFAVRQFLVESRLNVRSNDGTYPRIYIRHSSYTWTLLLPPPSSVAIIHQINIISRLCRSRRKMNVSPRGKFFGITRRGDAEVRTTNLSRFRHERHLHDCWL